MTDRETLIRSHEMFGREAPDLYNQQHERDALQSEREAVAEFKREVLPMVKDTYEADGQVDITARREAWNNWTDGLCKLGRITQAQYDSWEGPW